MTTPALQEIDESEIPFDAAGFAKQALASRGSLAGVIDHTLLKPEASREQVLKLCAEAAEYRFACAMVNPTWVPAAYAALSGTGVPVGVVVGFPLGANLTTTKRQEAAALVRLGARELDMVLNIGLLKSGENALVMSDIRGVAEIVHGAGAILKVILETSLLNLEEKLRASELACQAGADFLKTSTGFSSAGANAADVALLRGVAGGRCGVKASGGVRSLDDARAMLEAGANRIGASASVAIVQALSAA
ncbi:MAG: deoxyribose-phosphate aldolase [Silvibacterium sp.]|nr:deoxyribose-phosphate aldolase [Silvibacterium sp.]